MCDPERASATTSAANNTYDLNVPISISLSYGSFASLVSALAGITAPPSHFPSITPSTASKFRGGLNRNRDQNTPSSSSYVWEGWWSSRTRRVPPGASDSFLIAWDYPRVTSASTLSPESHVRLAVLHGAGPVRPPCALHPELYLGVKDGGDGDSKPWLSGLLARGSLRWCDSRVIPPIESIENLKPGIVGRGNRCGVRVYLRESRGRDRTKGNGVGRFHHVTSRASITRCFGSRVAANIFDPFSARAETPHHPIVSGLSSGCFRRYPFPSVHDCHTSGFIIDVNVCGVMPPNVWHEGSSIGSDGRSAHKASTTLSSISYQILGCAA
ncbi:hypothetical protein BC826DRAFT_972878 [Russula brevipes]|nr:hypothetical protein BC826DRAFT_972878 [Russula brevipes]